jgi:hypothetical protein
MMKTIQVVGIAGAKLPLIDITMISLADQVDISCEGVSGPAS